MDGVPSHRVGPTTLSHRRTAYASDQGPKFGGLYLFWDQDHTYIAFNSPNLSKQILMRIAQSVTPTSYGDMKFSRPPFPSPARYLAVDEFPDGRYRAYAHRLADRLVRVKGYISTRKLSIVAPDRDCVYHFASGCEPPIRWSFAGGWLNHPVATIQYIRPGSRARG